jgi:tRNA threonylcarbamoyladenosine biosynthesis protein TsaB
MDRPMQPRTLLALDTSTLVASVAVVVRDAAGMTIAASRESDVKNHSDQLISMIDEALAEAGVSLRGGVDGVAVGAGPGSFTGLRIGMSTAKGLCFAAGLPLWSVSSLAALARDAREQSGARVAFPVLDARRGEVFFGVYEAGDRAASSRIGELVATPARAAAHLAQAESQISGFETPVLIGDGAALYAAELAGVGELDARCRDTPSAASVGALALDSAPVRSLAAAVPAYLRPSEAERKFPDGNPGGAFAQRARDRE